MNKKSIQCINQDLLYYQINISQIMGKTWTETMNEYGTLITPQQYCDANDYTKIPYEQLIKGHTIQFAKVSYSCGLNALNMALKIFNYNYQLTVQQYPPDSVLSIEVGQFSQNYYKNFVKPLFTKYNTYYCGNQFPINLLAGTDFKKQALIVLVQFPSSLMCHYILVVGKNKDNKFIITDHSTRLYTVSKANLQHLMKTNIIGQSLKGLQVYNAYRIG